MEGFTPKAEKAKFNWSVDRSSESYVDIQLHKGSDFRSIGEFSFHIKREKKIDPVIHYLHKNDEPSFYSPEFIEYLRGSNQKESQDALEAIRTKPNVIARVGWWSINDEARGNLSTVRQLLRLALQECKDRNVEYIVGRYDAQSGEELSAAPYVADMYKRIAIMTGGEVFSNGEVWISLEGLEKWLTSKEVEE